MRRIAVRGIAVHDNKLLLVRLKPYNHERQNEFYCTIGGGLDEGEGLIDGVKREVLEETGVEARVGKLLFVQQYADKHDNLEFFFFIENAEDFLDIDLSKSTHGQEEIAEIGFFDPKNIEVLPKFLHEIDVSTLKTQTDPIFFNYL